MSEYQFLIGKAKQHWNKGEQLPIDLFYDLLGAGIDVEAAERKYMKEPTE